MNARVTKARTRRFRTTPSKAAELLDAVADKGAELSPRHREQLLVNEDLTQDATPERDPLPAKRVGLTRTKQADKTIRAQLKPKPPKRQDTSPPKPKIEGQEQELRKRQINNDSNDEPELKRARLTRKNLALFNKMMRKKASNNASASESTYGTSTKTTSTTSTGFALKTYDNGIIGPEYAKPPENLGDIRERYAQYRETPSPTESVYGDYVDTVGGAGNEATMVVEVSGHLLKKYPKGYKRTFNRAFTGFPKDVGFNNGLSAPQPDYIEGLEMGEFRPFPVHRDISGAVLYQDDLRSITLPHLAGEWKGPGKDITEVRLQSAYNGAALVYARNQALSYIGKSDPPGHAEVTTFTTDGTNLNLYAHYTIRSEDGTLEYHQYPVKSTGLVNSHQEHKDGRRGIRNEQDYARDQSYALRDQLTTYWKQHRGAHQPIAEGTHLDDIPEEPSATSHPDDDGKIEEPPPPTKPVRHKNRSRKPPPAYGTG